MPVTEESRHRLHQTLDRTIGEEAATTLMEHLPPVGWADVATKQDLVILRTDIDHRFDLVDHRFATERAHTEHLFAIERAHTDHRFDCIDQRLDLTFGEIDQKFDTIDHRLDRIEDVMRQQLWRLLVFFAAYGALLVAAASRVS